MKTTFKRITLALLAVLFGMLSMSGALAYHYTYQDPYYGYQDYPIYNSGYYYNTYTYGWSGWDYHKVYYHYHYPYSYNYYNYPSYWYGGPWVRGYAYQTYPSYVAYPWPGYYW